MKKVSVIFGTRPEAIKLCPLVLELKKSSLFAVDVCVTAQHREMLDQVLEVFGIVPDTDLNLMQKNQSLASLTSRAIDSIYNYLGKCKPGIVIIQGDTTTVLCAALAAFYHRIPIGHVEAGLRTGQKYAPFPEEMNRTLATHMTDFHFAPTTLSRKNLLNEGISEKKVFVTGNPVIDALYFAVEKIGSNPPRVPGLPEWVMADLKKPIVLITGHRRENFGSGFESICTAIVTLSREFPGVEFVYPVHLNPNVREPVFRLMSGNANIHLIEPLDYLPFVSLMKRCTIVLTDSGGIQEEAPSLGKPVLVMRDTTERPEAVDMGTVKLVGTDADAIVRNVSMLLNDRESYNTMANAVNPYGDGKACQRIVEVMKDIM